jgi:serine/threonine-protein kinase RsbW
MQTIYELTLESDIREVKRVEKLVQTMSKEHRFDKHFIYDLMVVITEATNNAILHGNALDTTKHAYLRCEIADADLIIDVWDEGNGFNPDTLPNPLAEENLMKPSGRGVFLMKQYATELKYVFSERGTTLSMRIPIRYAAPIATRRGK